MTKIEPVELNEQQVDMAAALRQKRVFLRPDATTETDFPYAVLADSFTGQLESVTGAEAWFVNEGGEKAEQTMPLPVFVQPAALRPLSDDRDLEFVLLDQLSPAFTTTALDAFLQFAEQTQKDFTARGQHDQAEATGQFRSYLQRFGLPGADDYQLLMRALTRTTDAVRKVFRDTCEDKPFPRGSECHDKLQALCEGDIALQTVGQRDTTWTPEKVTVAARQGWRITPANDGTAGLTITAVPGGRLAGDLAAYEYVCQQAKQGDLLALTACKETGIRIAEVNDYKPPVLGM